MPENNENVTYEPGVGVFNDENNVDYVSAGAPYGVNISGETAVSGDYPTDNDGNYENYVDAAPYDGYAKRVSHDTDNIAFRVYDHDYSPEAPEYGVYIDDEFVERASIVVGEVKKFEIRARRSTTSTPVEGEDPVTETVDSWTDDIPGLIWVSEDTTKAIIVEGNKIRAIGAGVVTIHIYNNNENAFVAELVLTVEEPSIDNVFTIEV